MYFSLSFLLFTDQSSSAWDIKNLPARNVTIEHLMKNHSVYIKNTGNIVMKTTPPQLLQPLLHHPAFLLWIFPPSEKLPPPFPSCFHPLFTVKVGHFLAVKRHIMMVTRPSGMDQIRSRVTLVTVTVTDAMISSSQPRPIPHRSRMVPRP